VSRLFVTGLGIEIEPDDVPRVGDVLLRHHLAHHCSLPTARPHSTSP
jgi:hypothetical protein